MRSGRGRCSTCWAGVSDARCGNAPPAQVACTAIPAARADPVDLAVRGVVDLPHTLSRRALL